VTWRDEADHAEIAAIIVSISASSRVRVAYRGSNIRGSPALSVLADHHQRPPGSTRSIVAPLDPGN